MTIVNLLLMAGCWVGAFMVLPDNPPVALAYLGFGLGYLGLGIMYMSV